MQNLGWIVALLLVLNVAPAIAQDAPAQNDGDWYQDETVIDVTFEGLDTVSENELRGITEQYIGEEFSESRFLDLQRRLYALDYFERVVPEAVRPPDDGDGVIIKFTVEERPTVREVVFRGNRNVRDRPFETPSC